MTDTKELLHFHNEPNETMARIWHAFNEAEKLKLKGEMENAKDLQSLPIEPPTRQVAYDEGNE